ncbi:4042_t:CDS:2, partial [Cetraspora pellucida]
TYMHHENSQVLNTAFALIALMAGKYPNEEPIRRGIQLIISRQLPTGEWKTEYVEGIINNMMINPTSELKNRSATLKFLGLSKFKLMLVFLN